MPLPSNCVPEDAITISSIPYSVTIPDIELSPQDTSYPTTCDTTGFHPLWWKYTPPAGINYVVFSANGDGVDYFPQLSIFTGTPPSLTQYILNAEQFFCGARAFDYWWSVPVIANTTYYIRFTDFDGTAPAGADLAVVFDLQPYVTAPPGSIVITDDTPGFPAVVLSILQDGEVFQTPQLPIGELAAVLPDGSICGSVGQGGTAQNAVAFYDAELTEVAQVALAAAPDSINANETAFYVSAGTTLYQFSAVGVQVDTWTPTALASNDFIIVNRAGTRCYYSSGIENTNVRTWNLDTDTAGATLYTIANNRQLQGVDGGTLANGNLWFLDESQVTLLDNHLRGYDTAGTPTFDYTVTTGTDKANHAAYYPGTGTAEDPESIWLWIYKAGSSAIDIFRRIKVSDGTVVDEFEVPGTGASGEPEAPDVRFAVSNSCPLIVLRQQLVPPETPGGGGGSDFLGFAVRDPIRWLRRTPILSDENVRLFVHQMTLDIQTGVGISTGQGSEPVVMFRYSVDSGWTWSTIVELPVGRIGEYSRRVMVHGLGSGRNYVLEFSGSDPVIVALIDCYILATKGAH